MAARSLTLALRVASALEFAGALVAWGLGALAWPIACVVETGTLVVFLFTFERDELSTQCAHQCDYGAAAETERCACSSPIVAWRWARAEECRRCGRALA